MTSPRTPVLVGFGQINHHDENPSVEPIDFRPAAELRDRITASPDLLDMLAPSVGVLLRDRVSRRSSSSRTVPGQVA